MNNFIVSGGVYAEVISINTNKGLSIICRDLDSSSKFEAIQGIDINQPELSDVLDILNAISNADLLENIHLKNALSLSGRFDISNLSYPDEYTSQNILIYPCINIEDRGNNTDLFISVEFEQSTSESSIFRIKMLDHGLGNQLSIKQSLAVNLDMNTIENIIRIIIRHSIGETDYRIETHTL